jgi:hypothetical protein
VVWKRSGIDLEDHDASITLFDPEDKKKLVTLKCHYLIPDCTASYPDDGDIHT